MIAPNKTQVKIEQKHRRAKPNENRTIYKKLPIRGFRKAE
jgi:hypothetical protein